MAAVTSIAATTMLLTMQRPRNPGENSLNSRKPPFAGLAQSVHELDGRPRQMNSAPMLLVTF